MSFAPHAVHRTVLCVDVEGFGDRRRTQLDQLEVRDYVYRSLSTAFQKTGVPWNDCYHEDRGDGLFVLVPPDVPKQLLVTSVPAELAILLLHHNTGRGPESRIRLRVAVDAGEVRHDRYGVVGGVITRAFRMLDAGVTRSALRLTHWPLVLVVSDWFFEEVVRHDPGCAPAAYQSVRVAVKEARLTAWIYAPDRPAIGRPTTERRGPRTPPRASQGLQPVSPVAARNARRWPSCATRPAPPSP
jgi:hypothetical protein